MVSVSVYLLDRDLSKLGLDTEPELLTELTVV